MKKFTSGIIILGFYANYLFAVSVTDAVKPSESCKIREHLIEPVVRPPYPEAELFEIGSATQNQNLIGISKETMKINGEEIPLTIKTYSMQSKFSYKTLVKFGIGEFKSDHIFFLSINNKNKTYFKLHKVSEINYIGYFGYKSDLVLYFQVITDCGRMYCSIMLAKSHASISQYDFFDGLPTSPAQKKFIKVYPAN